MNTTKIELIFYRYRVVMIKQEMPMANRIKEPNGKIKIKGDEFVSFCK